MNDLAWLARRIAGKIKREFWVFTGIGERQAFPAHFEQAGAIFIHIPKVAGISVAKTLYGRQVSHWRVRDLMALDSAKTRELFKFTFTRNPWDRLVSAYSFLEAGGLPQQSADRKFRDRVLSRHDGFDDFVRRWLTPKNASRQVHFMPQHEFVCDGRGEVVVDYVGRFENLAEDFRHVTQRMGVDRELPHHNPSRHEHYSTYYDEETREIARRVYAKDVELFDYSFERR